MSLLSGNFGNAGGGSGSTLFTSMTPGLWSYPVPLGFSSVRVRGWGGGGPGAAGNKTLGGPGGGGGGAGNFSIVVSVIGGVTILTGTIAAPGNPSGASTGGTTTLDVPACAATGGATASHLAGGAAGSATGTGTNTSGTAGFSGASGGLGGGAGNGGGNGNATIPGGGSAGVDYGDVSDVAAPGQIIITVT